MKKRILILMLAIAGFYNNGFGQSGKYLALDGTDDYMRIANSATVNIPGTSSFTLTCQVKLDNSATLKRIISKRFGTGNSAYELITGGSMQFGVNLSDASGGVGPPFSTATIGGAWHHLAIVVDRTAGTCTIYIDGVMDKQSTNDRIKTGVFSNLQDLLIGAWDNKGTLASFLKGDIDDIRLWSKAFTISEVQADITATVDGPATGLLAAWDFENVSGNTVPDISGNGNEGTLHGNPAIAQQQNMTYSSTSLIQTVRPVGKGDNNQRVLAANIITEGTLHPISVTSLVFNMNGTTDISDVSQIHLYYNGQSNIFNPATATKLGDFSPSAGDITFTGNQELSDGSNYFFLTYDLSASAAEGDVIDAEVKTITVGGIPETVNPAAAAGNRLIVLTNTLLFKPGDAGADSYRIPAIVTAADGSLVAVADQRNNGSGDLRKNGNIDIVVRRSMDNGGTWSVPFTIAGENTNYCYGDPSLVVDKSTGDILCLFNGNTGFFQSGTSDWVHIFVSRSTDNGVTWSTPKDITNQIYGPDCTNPISKNWLGVFVTSGRLTQLRNGRILGAMPVREPSGNTGVFTMYSDDGGYSWNVSTSNAVPSSGGNGNESKTVELDDGTVLMSIRTPYTRRYNKSTDGGLTWGTAYNSTLTDPGVDGDIVRYTSVKDGYDKSRLVHSLGYNPGSTGRKDVSLYVSYDEGATWKYRKTIDPEASAYSSVTVLDDGTLGIFYEDGENGQVYNLYFTRISLDWLTDGNDVYKPAAGSTRPTPDHALDLDGFNNYMSVENNEVFNIKPGENYSVSMWVKGADQNETYPRMLAKRPGAKGTGYEIFMNNSTGKIGGNLGPSGGTNYSSDVINDGKWHYVAITVDNSSAAKLAKVYIDGNLTTQSANNISDGSDFSTAADLLFGAANTVPVSMFYKGKIDDIHIWSKALSENEIQTDMTTQVDDDTPELLAAWDFENVEKDSVPDISGNNHPGKLFGYSIAEENDTVAFSSIPQHLQFFAREEDDSAQIDIKGDIIKAGFSKIKADFYKGNLLYYSDEQALQYNNGTAAFSLSGKIRAELKEYKVVISITDDNNITKVIATRDSLLCGDVYAIMGQSNSHPTRAGFTYKNEFLRSFGIQTGNTNYDTYNPADTTWGWAQANYNGAPGSVNANAPTFFAGPYMVGVWGLRMMDSLRKRLQIPICVINGGAGSSTIEQNLPTGDHYDLTTIYGRMLYRLKKSGLQDKVKALFWHQGEKNADASFENYPANFNTLYQAWKQDIPSLQRIYVFQTNLNNCYGAASINQAQMREWQRTLPQNYGDIITIATAGIPGSNHGAEDANDLIGCHYGTSGYEEMGTQAFYVLAQDLYGINFGSNVLSPDIKEAFYKDDTYKEIDLVFDNKNLVALSDLNGHKLKDYFYFSGSYGDVQQMMIIEDTVKFIFANAQTASQVTYLPARNYNGTGDEYFGPYLTNTVDGGALTFFEFPISNAPEPHPATPAHSLKMNGTDIYMSVEDATGLNVSTSQGFSISAWVKIDPSQTDYQRIFSKRLGSGNGYELFVGSQSNHFGMLGVNLSSPSSGGAFGTTTVNNDEWHHVAVVINPEDNSVTQYIDGVVTGSNTTANISAASSNFSNTQQLLFGAWDNNGSMTSFLKGELDDIHIWKTALDQEGVKEDAEMDVRQLKKDGQLSADIVAAWDFENISVNIVPDVSGNNHPGTLHGDIPWIEISAFSVSIKDKSTVNIEWNTNEENEVGKFTLDRSEDGIHFQKIGETDSKGNTDTGNNYSMEDTPLPRADTVYYLLYALDTKGDTLAQSNLAKISIHNNPKVATNSLSAEVKNENSVLLSWTVSEEKDISKYEIWKSEDGTYFNKIDTVPAIRGIPANEAITLTYTDEDLSAGTYHYYWKAISVNNDSVTISNIVNIRIEEQSNNNGGEEMDSGGKIVIYPNPVTSGSNFTLRVTSRTTGNALIRMTDAQGKTVRILNAAVSAGDTNIQIYTTGLPGGLYLIKLMNKNDAAVQKTKVVIE